MIYIERTITISNTVDRRTKVNNQSATIDNPVILYKGDKNVEVNFIIENSPYKHRAGLETTYGQLVIKRPNSAPIFSDIAKVSNGKVLFIITGEMIDNLDAEGNYADELGNYDFQIRLINADKTSRATLPPVSSGIVIKEPICEETTLNNSRINDGSTITYSMRTTDVFDDTGAYNMLNWQDGDTITDAKMNHIDTAIYEINDSKANVEHLHEQYLTEHQDISHLASANYVDTVAQNINNTISYLAPTDYVDEAIRTIELTPGPQGEQGPMGPEGPAGKDADPADLEGYATEEYVYSYTDQAIIMIEEILCEGEVNSLINNILGEAE